VIFPSIFQRYDIEFNDVLYDDQNWIKSSYVENLHLKILDLACGTGRSSIHFLNSGAEVTGIDNSQEALEIYRANADSIGKFRNLTLQCSDINLSLPDNKWDIILIVGNSIGIFESEYHLDNFFCWAKGHLNSNGVLMITMTFPENGLIPIGIEQPKRQYRFKNQFKYERSYQINLTETKFHLHLKYWHNDILVHQDSLMLNRFSWKLIKNISGKYFGEMNISTDLKYSGNGEQEGREPYEVFFKITKL